MKGDLLWALAAATVACGCTSPMDSTDRAPGGGIVLLDGGGSRGGGESDGTAGRSDDPGGGDDVDDGRAGDAGGVSDPADFDVEVPLDASRPVDLLPRDRLARVAERIPRVADDWLRDVLESTDTLWYDDQAIVPGYQDSFGDNVTTPIGMRPNTIDRNLIDLAVPGGHGWIFQEHGVFHFPFGRPAVSTEEHLEVVNFWHVPRDDGGELLPVVWWRRDPNGLTHRVEWMFPRGTVLGEMMFVVDPAGEIWPFEIRVRVRELDDWRVDLHRPFPTATGFADALARKRTERAEWTSSAEIDRLIAHVRDAGTLTPARLGSSQFRGAFPTVDGAEDVLPGLSDPSILQELLLETPFRSARGEVWKQNGSLLTFAPTTDAAFSIVPRDYAGGFLRVDEESCNRCHDDAGRPFRDWYPEIIAYGELWGEDETFSWHPFETSRFVDSRGAVVSFNYDNREMRADFVSAGVLAPYDRARHADAVYRKLPGEWKNYAY